MQVIAPAIRRLSRLSLRLTALAGIGLALAVVLGGSRTSPPIVSAAPSASGPIGGYTEGLSSVAMGVESTGRVHVLWTGLLNSSFDYDFAYYSSSADGVNWTPYQIVNYYMVYDPVVAVDSERHRAHLVYRSNYDGIVHRVVTNGVVGPETVIASTGCVQPSLAVDPTTGKVFLAWMETYMEQKSADTWQGKRRAWYAVWDGTAWTEPRRVIHDGDTANALVAAGAGPKVMLAWFQGWTTTLGTGQDAGAPAILRTAYSTDGATFPVRQQANPGTGTLPKADSFLLTWSPAAGKFYLLVDQLMWPGHSVVVRYAWSGTWSTPVQVSQNAGYWAGGVFAGASATNAYYVYQAAGVRYLRTENAAGVLSGESPFATIVTGTGLSGASAMLVDSAGKFHFVGSKLDEAGQANLPGLYYAHQ